MHAKMTRDRKKCYIASIKRVITKLEDQNQHLRETLEKSKALSANAAAVASEDNEDTASDASTSEPASGYKNLEASANVLSVLNFAGNGSSPSHITMGSSVDSDCGRLESSSLLSSDTKKSSDETEKKIDLSHLISAGGAFTFNSNMYAVG